MMKINIDERVIIIRKPTIPVKNILKKFYFTENTETEQGLIRQVDLMEYYLEDATEKEKRVIEKIIPYNKPKEFSNKNYPEYTYIIVI